MSGFIGRCFGVEQLRSTLSGKMLPTGLIVSEGTRGPSPRFWSRHVLTSKNAGLCSGIEAPTFAVSSRQILLG